MVLNPKFQRLSLLTGTDVMAALFQTRVLVFGLGGVGSWCAEALVRSGVWSISLIDFDKVEISNINRQIQATMSSIGQWKAEVLSTRLKEINPDCDIKSICAFFSCKNEDHGHGSHGHSLEKTAEAFGIPGANYIIDAIDSLSSKLDLIESAARFKVSLYSSMGMARRLDPTRIRTADIWKSSGCPLAQRVREGLRKRGFKGNFTVVYSDEKIPQKGENQLALETNRQGKMVNGSAVPVTASAGMILASLVVRDIVAGTELSRSTHE